MSYSKSSHKILKCMACKIKRPRVMIVEGLCSSCSSIVVECECGCGTFFQKYNYKGTSRRFIKAHINKGRVQSEKQKINGGKSRKEYYANHPEVVESIRRKLIKHHEDHPKAAKHQSKLQIERFKKHPELRIIQSLRQKRLYTKEPHRKIEHGLRMRGRLAGSANPMWNGGSSFEPYDEVFTEAFKEFIRERQHWKCADSDETCSNSTLNKKLHVHHIDRNKKNSTLENCIALCHSHHMRAHTKKAQFRHKIYAKELIMQEASCSQ